MPTARETLWPSFKNSDWYRDASQTCDVLTAPGGPKDQRADPLAMHRAESSRAAWSSDDQGGGICNAYTARAFRRGSVQMISGHVPFRHQTCSKHRRVNPRSPSLQPPTMPETLRSRAKNAARRRTTHNFFSDLRSEKMPCGSDQ